ncbi:PapB family radical SAM/SPASM ranthipeptide maturase [Lysinibacillus sp. NPDC094177]|uniref:PapB family radical SAM/SPASM ranthipeptide maturase n=1 Tax=Lysinibacillus sp. NPDC094177 TaxID=3390580 RepID=UPI003CFC5E65
MSIHMETSKKEIKVSNIKMLEDNHKKYIYVPSINGLFEIDDTIYYILSSHNKSMAEIYNQLKEKIEENEFYNIIDSLIENKIINDTNEKKPLETEKIKNISALTLMMVQECNLRCKYCYAGDGEYNEKGRMSIKTAKSTIDYLMVQSGERDDLSIVFFGGEPLLNFSVIKQTVEYAKLQAKLHNKKIGFSMTCNGTLINKEITKYILENNIAVQVSVDGNQDEHDFNRFYGNKKGSYDVIINRTKELREQKQLGVRATITPENVDLVEIYNHLFELNFRSIYAAPAIQMFSEEQFTDLSESYNTLISYFEELVNNKEYYKAVKLNNIMKNLERIHIGHESTYFCGAEVNFLAVDINGDLYPCHRFVNNKEYKQGNIFEGINSISKSEFLAEAHVSNRLNCNNCWAKNLCGGGCHHENLEMTGKVTMPPLHYCILTQKQLEATLYLYLRLTEEQREILLEKKNTKEFVRNGNQN